MMKNEVNAIRRAVRITASLEKKGISLTAKTHRSYKNLTFRNGRLDDGIVVTHPTRWELSGQTYSVRDVIKAGGFKWDAARKVWFAKLSADATELGAEILRALAA